MDYIDNIAMILLSILIMKLAWQQNQSKKDEYQKEVDRLQKEQDELLK